MKCIFVFLILIFFKNKLSTTAFINGVFGYKMKLVVA